MKAYFLSLGRILRLRCPRCGNGKLYRRPFLMHPHCENCGLDFNREPGFYLGSIYINYGLTALLTTIFYFVGFFQGINDKVLLWGLMAFCLLFPIVFFHHARAMWLAFDQYWDPQENAEGETGKSEIIGES